MPSFDFCRHKCGTQTYTQADTYTHNTVLFFLGPIKNGSILVSVVCLAPGQFGAPISFRFASLARLSSSSLPEASYQVSSETCPQSSARHFLPSLQLRVSQPSVYNIEACRQDPCLTQPGLGQWLLSNFARPWPEKRM